MIAHEPLFSFDGIDPAELIPLAESARLFPRKRGKEIPKSTIYRWAEAGVHGAVLPTLLFGRDKFTHPAAVRAFMAAMNRRPEAGTVPGRPAPIEAELAAAH